MNAKTKHRCLEPRFPVSRPPERIAKYKFTHSITRRASLLIGWSFFLSACSDNFLEIIGDNLRLAVTGQISPIIPRARIDAIPYASMAAKIGRGPRGLMILGRVEGQELHWISADRVVFVTRHGRLVRTAGLPANLKGTRLVDLDPLEALDNGQRSAGPFRRLVDLAPPDNYGIMITSSFESLGQESVVIAELLFDTEVFRERCTARDFDWTFENRYWVDPDSGLIWKSIQHIHPDIPRVELELLKPPGV